MYTIVKRQFIFGNLTGVEFNLIKTVLGITEDKDIIINREDCVTTLSNYLDLAFIPLKDKNFLNSILEFIYNFDGDIVFKK